MFRNLLDNAVRYARHRVLITAAAGPDGLVVRAGGGPGIPAEERERVFGRFVRLDASREQASGSAGLGLDRGRARQGAWVNGLDTAQRSTALHATRLHVIDVTQMS